MGGKGTENQRGAVLFVVLIVGIILAIVLFLVAGNTGKNRKDSVKNMKATQEFYLADAGFNYIKTRVTTLNREGGPAKVRAFLQTQKTQDWQAINFGSSQMGYFRLNGFDMVDAPMSVQLDVQGTKVAGTASRYESVQGVLRVPSLAKYARYVEGTSTLNYTAGTVVDGEILVAGDVSLAGSLVRFTRLVSTGGTIINPSYGQFDFGLREKEVDIPTLNDVHVNAWDNYKYDATKYSSTFEYMADNGGISLFGKDVNPKNGSWSGLNSNGSCTGSGPCDTLFAGCYDTLALARRSPVVVAGDAVALDLSQVTLVGDSVVVMVSPVVYDAGADGKDYFTLGTPARRYARPYATFKDNAVIYFPGDVYLTGQLKKIPVTVVSGDDVFLYGDFIGPVKTEVDAGNIPVTLGVVAQDRVYIHESSSRNLTIRAAILAENDEIIYDFKAGVTNWKYGYVCKREIFDAANVPASGATVDFATYFGNNFIWDDNRVRQSGFGREPEEECKKDGTCPNATLDDFGFVALAYARTKGDKWKLTFEGSLITRNPGSKGPKDKCDLAWDCSSDSARVSWVYDDNLGVAYPPKFPAPIVDDGNPSQIIGYKRRSF